MFVLVIDSDRKGIAAIAERLKGVGFETLNAASGEEAFLLLETRAEISFAFANPAAAGTPGMDLIRRHRPDIAILPPQTVDEIVRNVVPFARRRGDRRMAVPAG